MTESRQSKQRKMKRRQSKGFFDHFYYYLIGALLVILALMIGYILLTSRGAGGSSGVANRINITEKDFLTRPRKNHSSSSDQSSEEDSGTDGQQELDEDLAVPEGEIEVKVQKDAPYDSSYVPEFTGDSADMDAVERGVSAVTGLDTDDLVAIWIGNDGPGRIKATYTDSSYSEEYVVYFQYGDGIWHITDYEKGPYQGSSD